MTSRARLTEVADRTPTPEPTMNPNSILLTGATGFVGMELLARVLEQTDRDVIALVRARERRGRAGTDG